MKPFVTEGQSHTTWSSPSTVQPTKQDIDECYIVRWFVLVLNANNQNEKQHLTWFDSQMFLFAHHHHMIQNMVSNLNNSILDIFHDIVLFDSVFEAFVYGSTHHLNIKIFIRTEHRGFYD